MVKRLERLYEIVEVGASDDVVSRCYDFLGVTCILLNLLVSILFTFDGIRAQAETPLSVMELVTVLFFAADYVLRLITARFLYPHRTAQKAALCYIFSFMGVIDLLSFLPFFLPVFFPAGAVAFRMFRLVRILRLFRVGAYYDSLNVITEVLRAKKSQLLSSCFIILTLMLAASLCMYSLEHEAQPEVFSNAFSGIWWAVSTLLTVGYGDIYPVTAAGKAFSIVLTFLGVGLVAIPTGIISAGFVEQYAAIKRRSDYIRETDVNFIKFRLQNGDAWCGKRIRDLGLPESAIIAVVRRGTETIVPRGHLQLLTGDSVVLGAEPFNDYQDVELKEIVLSAHNAWVGKRLKDLDISRQTLIVMVRRGGQILTPNGSLSFREGDKVILYSKQDVRED
ncbi:MAG: ion transporter [Lachnospiraceae bacterium]|nr:ion transporter [Lachnospiraceae bacterium]